MKLTSFSSVVSGSLGFLMLLSSSGSNSNNMVNAYHTRSAICQTTVAAMSQSVHTGGPNTAMVAWTMSVTQAATAGQLAITLNNNGGPMLQGIILRIQNGATQAVQGTFVTPLPTNTAIKTSDEGGDGATGCGSSILEHTNYLATNTLTVTYNPMGFVGGLNISAVIIGSGYTDWTILAQNAVLSANGGLTTTAVAAPSTAAALQGIQEYRVYIIACGLALGIVVVATIVRVAVKRRQQTTKV